MPKPIKNRKPPFDGFEDPRSVAPNDEAHALHIIAALIQRGITFLYEKTEIKTDKVTVVPTIYVAFADQGDLVDLFHATKAVV